MTKMPEASTHNTLPCTPDRPCGRSASYKFLKDKMLDAKAEERNGEE
jgi:hypothetical protein